MSGSGLKPGGVLSVCFFNRPGHVIRRWLSSLESREMSPHAEGQVFGSNRSFVIICGQLREGADLSFEYVMKMRSVRNPHRRPVPEASDPELHRELLELVDGLQDLPEDACGRLHGEPPNEQLVGAPRRSCPHMHQRTQRFDPNTCPSASKRQPARFEAREPSADHVSWTVKDVDGKHAE